MTIVLSDNLVAPVLLGLRDCLLAELTRTPLGPPCRIAIQHGQLAPTMDGCDCSCDSDPAGHGDAWVRLVRLESDSALLTAPQACPPGYQATIEIGTYRCVPTPEDGEEADPLPAGIVTGSALDQLADMNALLRVFGCCPALKDNDVGFDLWQPAGPMGGCGGGTLQFRVAIPGGPGGCS